MIHITSNLDIYLRADVLTQYDIVSEPSNRNCVKYMNSFTSSSSQYETTITGINSGNLIFKLGSKIYDNLTTNIMIILEYTKTTD